MSSDVTWEGSQSNRLSGWAWYDRDLSQAWISESAPLADRASHAVRNDPVVAALKTTAISYCHGSKGLRFRSLVDDDAGDLRDQIEAAIAEASEGCNLDADGMMTRLQIDETLDGLAFERGEGFAVRVWAPQRPGAVTGSAWRVLDRNRVCNPPGMLDGPRLYQGISLGPTGAWDGAWVAPTDRAMRHDKKAWTFIPRYDRAGLPSLLWRTGARAVGMIRAVSEIAPLLPVARQVKGLVEAYVVGKRIQSCHPIFIKCADPVAAAKKDRNGAVWGPNTTLEPGKTYYVGEDANVIMPTFSFQGADLKEFLDVLYRNEFAAVGYPVDVVLAQLTQTNMAASRSAWLQLYRQSERRQDAHIAQVCKPMDMVIIAEAIASGRITLPAGMTLADACRGQYIRPVRSMPDPLKEAQAVEKWVALGRDKTSLWSESAGSDYRDSVVQRAEDDKWAEEYGVEPEPEPVAAPGQPAPAAEPEDDNDDAEDDDDAPTTASEPAP